MTQQIGAADYPMFSKEKGRLSGKDAWSQNLRLASLAGSKIESSLGPMGAYKLVMYHRGPELVAKVTKDAVEIVDELGVQYPAIKTLAEAAKIQRDYVGDGTSTLLILISSLLAEADKLIEQGMHPITILDGYHEATTKSIAIIDQVGKNVAENLDERLLEVVDCGRGLLTKHLRTGLSEALRRVQEKDSIDVTRIAVVKKIGGTVEESQLVRGVIIKKGKAHPSMPDDVDRPKVAIVNKKMEIKPLELKAKDSGPFSITLNISKSEQLPGYKSEESRLRTRLVERVASAGASVLICRSRIEERIADRLSRAGIFAMQMVDQKEMDEVAKATGARIIGDVDKLQKEDLGIARRLELDKIGPDHIAILHCDGTATLLLRGSSLELVQELEKTAKKALLVLKHSRTNPKVIPGGGAIFIKLASQLRTFALSFPGREQLAISSFANALEKIPESLATNYGLDPIDTVMQLHRYHSDGQEAMGVGELGCVDSFEANVIELASINKETLRRTFEVVQLLLRIDDCFFVKDMPVFHKQ